MNKLLSRFYYLILIFIFLLSSCISNKRITYLQNLPGNPEIGLDEYIPYAEVDYKYILQPFDIVSIDFASSNEKLIAAFEYQGSRSARGGGGGGGGSLPPPIPPPRGFEEPRSFVLAILMKIILSV